MVKLLVERVIMMVIGSALTYYVGMLLLAKSMDDSEAHTHAISGAVIQSSSMHSTLDDVKGLDVVKRSLIDRVVRPLENTSLSNTCSLLVPPNGVILHGPPGTGKTMLAKALCKRINCTFIPVGPSLIENKLFGESPKILKALFAYAAAHRPAVIFIDEIDGVFAKRSLTDQNMVSGLRSTMLSEMDGITERHPDVLVIGTTNNLKAIDPAILRRMRTHIYVPLPDKEARLHMFHSHLDTCAGDIKWDTLADTTEGMSGSDIFEICKLAALSVLSDSDTVGNIVIQQQHVECIICEFSSSLKD